MNYLLGRTALDSPFMNSAGSLHGNDEFFLLDRVSELARTRIGAIVLGSFTVPAREGNAAAYGHPVFHYDVARKAVYNCKGLPGPGLERIIELAPEFRRRAGDKPLIFSGSTTWATPQIGEGPAQISRLAYAFFNDCQAKVVEVDAGCPHVLTTDGSRMPIVGYDLEVMEELVNALRGAVGTGLELGIKLPPYLTDQQQLNLVPKLAKLIAHSGVFSYLATSNTVPDQVARDDLGKVVLAVPGGRGGMSGPACKSIGRAQLVLWKASLAAVGRPDFPIVSSLGVDGAEEVNARLRLGAAAAGGTSMFMLSMHWAETVRRVVDNLERIGYARGPDLNASPANAASTLLIDPLIVP